MNHYKTNRWAKSLNYAVSTSRVMQHCTGNNGVDGDICEREITRIPKNLPQCSLLATNPTWTDWKLNWDLRSEMPVP
jgi:hypothetical protein